MLKIKPSGGDVDVAASEFFSCPMRGSGLSPWGCRHGAVAVELVGGAGDGSSRLAALELPAFSPWAGALVAHHLSPCNPRNVGRCGRRLAATLQGLDDLDDLDLDEDAAALCP